MKKFIVFILILTFFVISCSSSKKTENDTDLLPDEDVNDEAAVASDEDDVLDEDNPCEKMANSNGEYFEYYDYNNGAEKKYKCGCSENSFQLKPGCRKITYANVCTGVKECYSTWEKIECREPGKEFYGQDVQYEELGYCIPKKFSIDKSVKDEWTVFDKNLKIEWMNKISDETYNWYDAILYCRDLKYGGKDDWRLPLPQELLVAYDISVKSGVTLWSDLVLANKDDSYAWKIDPNTMKISFAQKIEQNNVRCVRGDLIDVESSFKSIDNNLSVDYKNGLMWSTANYTRDKMWNEALAECENSTAAGFSDWRLPNIHELVTLLNFEKSDPASDFPYPENIPVYFWSSTTLESNIEESPGVTIYGSGEIKNLYKPGVTKDQEYNMNRVVCVRNELCKENYFWNGVDCVESPCSKDPCKNDVHSDGVCHFESTETYSCGCVENYFWDGVKCVNPCDAEPCKNHKHSNNKKCEPRDKMRYTCGCEEGFWWWGQNKGCLERKPDLAHICTGQTKCYDDEKEIKCPEKGEKYYGQDAQYADLGYCAPPNYTIEKKVENEPVVIDNYTGLSWQQKVYVPENYIGWRSYLNYCKNSTYGGYDDWRVPSLLEYRTIMNFGRHHPNIDPKYFPDTPPEYFVTSTYTSYSCGELPHITPATWVRLISFDHFDTDSTNGCADDPSFILPARCVRGNESFGERSMSEINVSGTKSLYIDNKNSLLWAGAPGGNKWAEALDYCENLTLAELSEWRLPNINELSLFMENLNNRAPAYSYYYSSTTEEYDSARSVLNKLKTRGNYMLCVRENPCETGQFWDGSKCMKNPCADLPCKDIDHSDTKECTPVSDELYSCSCNYYYYWNFNSMRCTHSCEGYPCQKQHSTGECFDDEIEGYRCGCEEGYSWDFDSKKCLDDNETDDESGNDADSSETPDIDADNNAVSDMDIVETADETNDADRL